MKTMSRTSIRFLLGAVTLSVFLVSAPHAFAAALIHVSNNWAGYEVTAGTYTGVSGNWTVPKVAASSQPLSADAVWVGVGGAQSNDLIQAGTQAVTQDGKTTYQAWYETLPDAQSIIPLAVHPGDHVSVSLLETSPDLWHLTFTNETTGIIYQLDIVYSSSHSSAEWIIERPLAITVAGTGYLPLNDFGKVKFTNAATIENGKRVALSDADADQLVMAKRPTSGTIVAAPSSISDIDGFSVSYMTSSESRSYMRTFHRVYKKVPNSVPSHVPVQDIPTGDDTFIVHIVF